MRSTKIKNLSSSSLWTCLHHMVMLRSQNKISDFFMILAWACPFNPLNPHDALKHHFTSLKTDLIFLYPRILKRKFPRNWFTNTWQFSLLFHPHEIIFIHYKSRVATAIRGL